MKKILTFLFVLNAYAAFCQLKPLQSITWVSDNFGTLHFTNANNRFFWELDQSFKLYSNFMASDFEYYQTKDTLVLIETVQNPRTYKFIMTRKGNESLSFIPANDEAKKAIPLPVYVLRNIAYVDDPTVKFTSIHLDEGGYSESPPVGLTYSQRTINIDNKGNYYLKMLSNGYKSPVNYFKGKLDPVQLDSLNYFIQHSEIKKLQNWKQIVRAAHAPEHNLIIAYNDNVLKLNASILPGITRDLVNYILSLEKKLSLEPDGQKHDFTKEGDLNYYK